MDEKTRTKRKNKMLKLRDKGYTLAQIGEEFGLSRQRVHDIVGEANIILFRYITPKRVIYPNLRAWMNDNKISLAEICRRLYGTGGGTQCNRLSRAFKGDTKNLRFWEIKKLIEMTGLTFEALFDEE